MLKVFNLLYLSKERSEQLLRLLDDREVEYTIANESNQDTGWIVVDDDDEYTYARDIVDDFLAQPVKKKPIKSKKKVKKGAIVFSVVGALLFLSRYIKDFVNYF